MIYDCDNLDDFLAGDLHGDAAERFRAHLRDCEACREAESQQRWIDGLLASPKRLQLEPAPRALVESVRKSPAPPLYAGRRYAAAVLAVAAVVLVATGLVLLNREANDGTRSAAEIVSPSDGPQTVKNEEEREAGATFIADSNAIAVPVESHQPGVTIVRVYPTIQPRVETQTAAVEPSYTTNLSDFWIQDSNGG
jgi:putative zinc finger protein